MCIEIKSKVVAKLTVKSKGVANLEKLMPLLAKHSLLKSTTRHSTIKCL